jgi:aldose 1-epimerase
MTLPSGEQFALAFEDQSAVVVEVGGGLRSYARSGRRILDGYEENEVCSSGRGQLLAPWPNRLRDGEYEFGGHRHQLPINDIDAHSAIHGLVRWSSWREAEREPERLVLAHDLHPQPGYPFALALRVEYALSRQGLRVSLTATNVGAEPCPFGAGAHPYLVPGPARVDAATLQLPAAAVMRTSTDGSDAERAPVEGSELDFRQPRPIGDVVIDHCFADLDRDSDGLARVRLANPADGSAITLWLDSSYEYLMLYTGDDRPDVRRRSIAIEPMTCPPQALRTGEAVIVLAPAASVTATWGIEPC